MNRRSLFSFLAIAPLGVAGAVASSATPDGPPPVAVLVEGPDWHRLGGTPDDVPGFDATWFDYALVTDHPYFTRAAVWGGWYKIFGRPSGVWTDTGLPCALVRRLKPEIRNS